MSKNSVAVLQVVESTWMLKSPNRIHEGEMAQSWVRNSERSERNAGLGLGGRYMIAVTRGLGPGSLNDWYSNEEGVVMVTGVGFKC